jgi:O-antigen/teichoic acid export membrane protein
MALVSAAAFFAAPLAVRVLGGAAFAPAVPIFRILLLSMLGMTVSAVMGSQWIARGLFAQVSAIAVTLAVISVAGNWLVVPAFGIGGAAWLTVGVYMLAFLVNGGLAVRIDRRIRATRTPPVTSGGAVL